ncbi:Crp/Fnr family transcriptional regulator [Flavobacterium sp. JP2137]|uniref:Crp/Fnr family transcriptional regulator n=1 Tax=Flavobacterium sp. JP2137 TaxID=3414510 RepID=UPI003D300FE9
MTPLQFSPLWQSLSKITPLNPEDYEVVHAFFKKTKLRKKDCLLKAGDVSNSLYFVSQGCLRMFFVADNGQEKTAYFALEQWWISDFLSFTRGGASSFYIDAVEKSEVYELTQVNQELLLETFPALERYFRIHLERAYGAAQYRVKYHFSLSKEENYIHFKSLFPEFIQRVPQYMLASFLGLTPEYLSEIRKKNL